MAHVPRSTLGLVLGVVLGYAAIFQGFGAMLVVALLAALGWAAGKVVDGEIDLAQISDAVRRR